MNRESPLITIGIPSHNRAALLPQALESALHQQCEAPFEILVVDDASNKETREVLTAIKDPKLRIIFSENALGVAGTRNFIVDNMRGQYLIWLDDDDALLPEALSSHLRILNTNAHAQISYGNLRICNHGLKPEGEWRYRQIDEKFLLYTMLFYDPIPNGGTMVHRSVFERTGRYDQTFSLAEDYDFWARAAAKGCRFVHNDSFVYAYRKHPGSRGLSEDVTHAFDANAKVVQKILENVPLEQIFTLYNWKQAPKPSAALAFATVALIFCKYRKFESALEALQRSEAYGRTRESVAVRGLLHSARGDNQQATELLTEALALHNPHLQMIFEAAELLPKKHRKPGL